MRLARLSVLTLALLPACADPVGSPDSPLRVLAAHPSPLVTGGATTLSDLTLAPGDTMTFTASLVSPGNKPRSVKWMTRNPAVASASDKGNNTALVTATGAGTTYVVASNGPRADSAKVTVTAGNAAVDSVEVTPASSNLQVGWTEQFTATLRDASGNVLSGIPVTWASTNPGAVSVSSTGLATGAAQGSAFVTATAQGKVGSATVTVAQAAVATIAVAPSTATLIAGGTQQFTATLKDAGGATLTGRTVSWSSTNTRVAQVNGNGLATALAAGVDTIYASSEGKDGAAVLTVTAGTCPLVTDWGYHTTTAHTEPVALAKPGYLQSATDPEFGTRITRITGDPGTPIGNGISGTWPSTVYGNYPKDPVWTADQALLVLKHMSGVPCAGCALVLDGATYQPLKALTSATSNGGEWRLHPTTADVAVYLDKVTGAVYHWNIRTNAATLKVAAVSGYATNEIGPFEGNLSYDGRYLVAKATRSSDGHLVARVLDVDGGTAGAVIDLTAAGLGAGGLDWVTISAGGGYVVGMGDWQNINDTRYVKVWNRATGALVQSWTDYVFGHSDLGVDAAGNEVIFTALQQGSYVRTWATRRLGTGTITQLSPTTVTSYNYHSSVRNTARGGWAYGVTNDRTGAPLDGEIYALKTDGSQSVQRLAHHRAEVTSNYDTNPFPTPSPDGRRVLFSSNWRNATGPIQTYVVDTRQLCPSGLP